MNFYMQSYMWNFPETRHFSLTLNLLVWDRAWPLFIIKISIIPLISIWKWILARWNIMHCTFLDNILLWKELKVPLHFVNCGWMKESASKEGNISSGYTITFFLSRGQNETKYSIWLKVFCLYFFFFSPW